MEAREDKNDLTVGSLPKKIILFVLPVIFTSLLQLVYSTADLLVARYFGDGALSMTAIADNSALINLIVNTFVAMSVGVNVVVADAKGAKDPERAGHAISSGLVFSLILGAVMGIAGCFLAKYFLILMHTPDTILPKATTYLSIYFAGIPFLLSYNFLTASLRGLGDSRSPLLILIACGAINVGGNFLCVYLFNNVWHIENGDVMGVAISTISCQAIEAIASVIVLFHKKKKDGYGLCKEDFAKPFAQLKPILKHGLPSGLEIFLFALSNVTIQAQANLLGDIAVTGGAASDNIEGYVFAALEAFAVAEVALAAQNYAASEYKRVKKSLGYCYLFIAVLGLTLAGLVILFRRPLINLYINSSGTEEEEKAISVGCARLALMGGTYWMCGFMDTGNGYLRGLHHPILPTVIALLCGCLFRVIYCTTLWRFVIFPMENLSDEVKIVLDYAAYPICWVMAMITHAIVIPRVSKKDLAERA